MRFPVTDLENLSLPPIAAEPIEDSTSGALKIGFIGAGQGGVRIVESFYNMGYTRAIGVNTTTQDTTELPNFILLETPGQPGGAGKDPRIAHTALNRYTADVYSAMGRVFGDVDQIFIVAGLGGGTGSGCAVALAQLAVRYLHNRGVADPNKRVGVIAALPKQSELSSAVVKKNAFDIASDLSGMADSGQISPFILIDNAKIEQLYKGQLSISKFYPTINSTAAQLFGFFNEIAMTPSNYTTFDGRDFQRVVQAGGHATLGLTTITDLSSEDAISKVIRRDLDRTLLSDDFDLSTAKFAAVIVVASKKLIEERAGLQELVDHVYDTIGAMATNATVFRGLYEGPKDQDRLVVYTFMGGMNTPVRRYERLR